MGTLTYHCDAQIQANESHRASIEETRGVFFFFQALASEHAQNFLLFPADSKSPLLQSKTKNK